MTAPASASAGSSLTWQPLVPEDACPPFDFPKTNPQLRGKPYRQGRVAPPSRAAPAVSAFQPSALCLPPRRYVFAASSTRPTNAHNSVAKFDTQAGTVQVCAADRHELVLERRQPHCW